MSAFAPRYQKRCALNRAHGWYWTDRHGARYGVTEARVSDALRAWRRAGIAA